MSTAGFTIPIMLASLMDAAAATMLLDIQQRFSMLRFMLLSC